MFGPRNLLVTCLIVTQVFLVYGCGIISTDRSAPELMGEDKSALPDWLKYEYRTEKGSYSYGNAVQYQPEKVNVFYVHEDAETTEAGCDQGTPANAASGTPAFNLPQPNSQSNWWLEPPARDPNASQSEHTFKYEVVIKNDAD